MSVAVHPIPKPEAVLRWLRNRFDERRDHAPEGDHDQQVVSDLARPLLLETPHHSQGAEAALVVMAFSITGGRKLSLDPTGGDVSVKTGRIKGDRTVGDKLCAQILTPRGIPATKGPFQSSSFRAGYRSPQVRDPALRAFLNWYESADLPAIELAADDLISRFLEAEAQVPELPRIDASSLSFSRFRSFLETLFGYPSGGAYEQYMFAALLEQERSLDGSGERVETKNVRANDAASGSAGDVIVRRDRVLVAAYEVTAQGWRAKLPQIGTSTRAGLTEVSIVAADAGAAMQGADLEAELVLLQAELAVDVAVLDLMATLDLLSSRIGKFGRSAAVRYVYACLVRWQRREPRLFTQMLRALNECALTLDETGDQEVLEADEGLSDEELETARRLADDLIAEHSQAVLAAALRHLS